MLFALAMLLSVSLALTVYSVAISVTSGVTFVTSAVFGVTFVTSAVFGVTFVVLVGTSPPLNAALA